MLESWAKRLRCENIKRVHKLYSLCDRQPEDGKLADVLDKGEEEEEREEKEQPRGLLHWLSWEINKFVGNIDIEL